MTTSFEAELLVEELITDLKDRQGFDAVWDDTDETTRSEITIAWERIAERHLKEAVADEKADAATMKPVFEAACVLVGDGGMAEEWKNLCDAARDYLKEHR